jgi:hypothetical protein
MLGQTQNPKESWGGARPPPQLSFGFYVLTAMAIAINAERSQNWCMIRILASVLP